MNQVLDEIGVNLGEQMVSAPGKAGAIAAQAATEPEPEAMGLGAGPSGPPAGGRPAGGPRPPDGPRPPGGAPPVPVPFPGTHCIALSRRYLLAAWAQRAPPLWVAHRHGLSGTACGARVALAFHFPGPRLCTACLSGLVKLCAIMAVPVWKCIRRELNREWLSCRWRRRRWPAQRASRAQRGTCSGCRGWRASSG